MTRIFLLNKPENMNHAKTKLFPKMRGDCFSKCFPLFEASGSLPTVFLFLSLRNQHQKEFTEHFSMILSDNLTIFHKKAINPLWKVKNPLKAALRKKCPYSELFWSAFSLHFTAFGLNTERYQLNANQLTGVYIRSISPYLVRMRETRGKCGPE